MNVSRAQQLNQPVSMQGYLERTNQVVDDNKSRATWIKVLSVALGIFSLYTLAYDTPLATVGIISSIGFYSVADVVLSQEP